MSFLRPGLAFRLRRWREPVLCSLLLACGLWLLGRAIGGGAWLLGLPGVVLTVAGAGLLLGAISRLRLSAVPPGEGVVVIDEGRIGYLGPLGGGFVDLSGVFRVEITGEAWLLSAEDGTRLEIPRGAAGAERLPDALSPLPGLDLDAAAAAVARGTRGRTLVWRRASPRCFPR